MEPGPKFIDVRLDWLVERTELTQPWPDRRLNGIENLLARLAKQWRIQTRPVDPRRELRMSWATVGQLLGWVLEKQEPSDDISARLNVYASGQLDDDSVRDGWIRFRLSDVVEEAK